MKSRSYRLDEYCITEYDGAALSWERHVALAEQRSGRCSILGDVLILGECSDQETGYLSGEFFERMKELPAWNRTRYYCLLSELLDTSTAQRLTSDVLEKRISSIKAGEPRGKTAVVPGSGSCRLGRYKISVAADGEVRWQTHEGLNGVAGGRCILESALLFIGPREYEGKDQGREAFNDDLAQLPLLDGIIAWGQHDTLRTCQEEQKPKKQSVRQRGNVVPSRVERTSRPGAEIYPVFSAHHYAETIRNILLSAVDRLKAAWERHAAARIYRQRQRPRKQEDAVSSRVVQRPIAEMIPASNEHHYPEIIRSFLTSAVSAVKTAWQRMSMPKGWMKCVVPAVIAILLLGAALAFFLIEKGSESSHHSKEHHHKHHD